MMFDAYLVIQPYSNTLHMTLFCCILSPLLPFHLLELLCLDYKQCTCAIHWPHTDHISACTCNSTPSRVCRLHHSDVHDKVIRCELGRKHLQNISSWTIVLRPNWFNEHWHSQAIAVVMLRKMGNSSWITFDLKIHMHIKHLLCLLSLRSVLSGTFCMCGLTNCKHAYINVGNISHYAPRAFFYISA